jgi:hypothetical protein
MQDPIPSVNRSRVLIADDHATFTFSCSGFAKVWLAILLGGSSQQLD